MNFLGIEIGGTKLQIVAGHADKIEERRRFSVDATQGGEGIRGQISSALPELVAKHSPSAVGVGFGGPVDARTGCISCSHQISGWSGFPLAEWITEQTGLSCRVDNDANVAAWGESRRGSAAGANPLFYITLGSGVGGGLIVDGHIYRGAVPGEGEIGHVRMSREGATLESLCAGWAIDRKIRDARAGQPGSILFKLIGSESTGEARHLARALEMEDALAQRILRELGEDLAFGLSHMVHLMHPEAIVLGGGLALIGEPLRLAVAAELPAFLMSAFQPGPRIVISALGENAVPIGALLLAECAHSQST